MGGWVPGNTNVLRTQNNTLYLRTAPQWPYDEYICHGRMTSCGRGRDSATPECLGKALERRFSFEARNYLFSFQSYVRFGEFFFVSRAFEKFGAKRSSSGAGFNDDLDVFLKTSLRHWAVFANSNYDHEYFFENFLSFFRAEPVLLAWQLWRSPGWVKHVGGGTSKTRMKTWLPGVGEIERRRTIDRRRDWYESCAVIHGPKEKKKKTRKSACDCAKAQPFVLYKPASFEEPVSETRCRYRFALRCFRRCGCTAVGRSGCSAGTAKKSSHPWHFRCWSLRRNELECTDLVHWTGA